MFFSRLKEIFLRSFPCRHEPEIKRASSEIIYYNNDLYSPVPYSRKSLSF